MKKENKENLPVAARFMNEITKEFAAITDQPAAKFDERHKRLAQHLFIKMDADLQALEKKRSASNYQKNQPPIIWANINMQKLAIDAVHRIDLGLDALIDNHIAIIPYLNNRTKKYDVDLRIGYVGKDFYKRKMAVEPPANVIYELVHETDKFVVIKKDDKHDVETYEFEITQPFNRGKVIGGFGYIIYKNPTKNKLVLVSEDSFKKSEKLAKAANFWRDWPEEMRFGKLVHRTMSKLQIDPAKVTQSFAAVEADEKEASIVTEPETDIKDEIKNEANRELIDINEEIPENTEISEKEAEEIIKNEIMEAEKSLPDF